jgi:hypothetical protein
MSPTFKLGPSKFESKSVYTNLRIQTALASVVIPTYGTPYVLARAVSEGFLSKEQAKIVVKDMVSSGWRCNVETYAKIIELMDKM